MSTSSSKLVCAYEVLGQPSGSAPTLVLAHSLGADRGMWLPQLEALGGSYHVLALDLRGHGRSAVPPGPYTLEALARDVLAVLDRERIERAHYCGISLGGMIGLQLALSAPERFRSLSACNTAARIGTAQSWQARIEAVRGSGMRGIRPAVVPRWFGSSFPRESPALYAAIEATFEATSPDGYVACCEALGAADLRSEVSHIALPTWVVGGESDLSTPPDEARFLHEQIAGSVLTIFREAAHLSNLDRQDAFTRELRLFLAAH